MRDEGGGILGDTMRGLESGLTVAHIATFELQTCDEHQDAAAVLADKDLGTYDQIPVRRRDRVVGVLERDESPRSGPVAEHMGPLHDTLLVSAEGPLMSFVRKADQSHYRLVVRGTEVSGIVTRSDLLQSVYSPSGWSPTSKA